MPFPNIILPEQLPAGQPVFSGDVEQFPFSRIARLKGVTTAGLLTNAPPLTLVGNLLTVESPAQNWSAATFAGLGLTVNTSIAAGAFPEVALREVVTNAVASTGHTYTYPLARQVGQLLIVAVATAALTTITTPGGWTLVSSQAGTASRTSVFRRLLDGSEASTELLAFGTTSACIVRSWCINRANGAVEATAGLNDSAAGTSLDLAAVTPTWAVAEATNTLYIAVIGTDIDVTVSGFPAGYTVTGQDLAVSATANLDCTLAYAEKTALGSTEDPGAFTYPAARSTGHILAIQPQLSGRMDWDGLAVRKTGSLIGTRRAINIIDGTNITATVADNAGTGAVDITLNVANTAHIIRDDGAGMTQRAALNFVSSTTVLAVLADDAGNNETEVSMQLAGFTGGDITSTANSLVLTISNNAVTNAKAADMAANTIKANPTAGSTDPSDMAVGTNTFVGRLASNIQTMTGTQATTLLDVFTSALKGLAPASGGGTTNFLRADGTWAAPGGGAAGHVIEDDGTPMTRRANLNFTSTTTILAVLTDDAVNNETEVAMQMAGFTGGDITSSVNSLVLTIANNAVTNAKANDMPALTVKANATNATADPQDVASAADDTVFRRTATTLNWGALTVGMAPNDLWTYAKLQNVSATSRILGRITAGAGDIEELTGTQATTLLDLFTSTLKGLVPLSGGGTTNFLRADGTWAVPPGSLAGHVIRDDGVGMTQRAALNFTSTTTILAVLVDDSVGGETEVGMQMAGFTGGDITSSANSLVLTIAADAVTNGKLANMAGNTVKLNGAAGAADPTDFAITTNTFLGRLASNIQVLTGTQATTLLDVFTSALKGLAPASGGGTTNFLRADGTWAAPPGTLTAGHGVRVNGSLQTQRGNVNLLTTTTIAAAGADDAGNNETELSFTVQDDSIIARKLLPGTLTLSGAGPHNNIALTDDIDTILCLSALTITGIANGWKGRTIDIITDGEQVVAITCSSPLSSLGNQILTPDTIDYVQVRGGCRLRFDTTPANDCWRMVATVNGAQVGARFCKWDEDFEFYTPTALPGIIFCGNSNWYAYTAGSAGGSIDFVAGQDEHPGVIQLTTHTVNGDRMCLHRGRNTSATPTHGWIQADNILLIEFVVNIPTITTFAMFLGVATDPSLIAITGAGSSADFIGFFFDTANGAINTSVTCCNRAASGSTTSNGSGVSPSGWHKYAIRQIFPGTIQYLIDDVIVNTHTTNVPTTAKLNLACTVYTRTVGFARTMLVDYVGFTSKILSR